MHWITDIINVVLTAAIAWAGYRQYVVSNGLLKLQETIEKERHASWLFFRVKPQFAGGHNTAILEVSNLSQMGVWIEHVTVHFVVPPNTPNRAHTLVLQRKLNSFETLPIDLREEITLLAAVGLGVRTVTFWTEVHYWGQGVYKTEPTTRYVVDVDPSHVSNVRNA